MSLGGGVTVRHLALSHVSAELRGMPYQMLICFARPPCALGMEFGKPSAQEVIVRSGVLDAAWVSIAPVIGLQLTRRQSFEEASWLLVAERAVRKSWNRHLHHHRRH